MPKSYAQWIGMLVTGIVVLGTDSDVLVAVPYGMAAGALTVFFVSLSEWRQQALLLRRVRRYRP